MRGNLMFIERALGVMEFAKLTTPPDGEPLSQRELARQLNELGYTVSQPVISAMDYAVNRLYGLLPTALEHGMGKRLVMEVRTLEHCAVKVWERQCPDEASEFPELFSELVKHCDGVTFDLEQLATNVANEIAVASDLDINGVRFMLDAERAGDPIELDQYVPVVPDDSRKHDEPTETRPFSLDRELQKSRSTAIEACVALAERFELSDCVHVMIDARFWLLHVRTTEAQRDQDASWGVEITCHRLRSSTRIEARVATDLETRLASHSGDRKRPGE